MKSWKKFASLVMALALAGCATLTSFDWMGMIKQRYAVTSGEGTMNLKINIFDDASTIGKMTVAERDTWRKLHAFQDSTLQYSRIKENASTWSWDGSLQLADGTKIPLQANVRDGQFAVLFDGQTEPLVIPLHVILTRNGWTNMPLTNTMKTAFDRRFAEIVPIIVTYLAGKMPVPQAMEVEDTEIADLDDLDPSLPPPDMEPVRTVTHVNVKLNAQQLSALAGGLLDNVLKDTTGLDQTVEKIFALLTVSANVPADQAKVAETDQLILNILKQYVRTIFTGMQQDWKVASKNNALQVQWWMDQQLNVRQFAFDLTYYPVRPWSGIKGYRVAWERETWNPGKAVKAKEVSFTRWPKGTEFDEKQWIQKVTTGTAVHRVVSSSFQANRKSIDLIAPATPKPTPKPKATPVPKGKKPTKVIPTPTVKPFEKEVNGVLWRTKGSTMELFFSTAWLQKQSGWSSVQVTNNKEMQIIPAAQLKPIIIPAKQLLLYKNVVYVPATVLTTSKLAAITNDPFAKSKWTIITDP